MKKRKLLLGLLAGLLCLSCTACGSSLAENTETYFSTTSAILKTLFASGQTDKPAATPGSDSNAVQLDAPAYFTVGEDGSYSFTGVENAEYYLIYFCATDATSDEDTFIYSSDPIEANDSNTYSGLFSDAFQYAFGDYLVKVYAFPDLTDDAYRMSTAATAEYVYSGNQSAPEINYYWNTFDGTMGVQVANMNAYLYEAYPDKVDVTFTNTADSSDTVTLTIDGVSPENFGTVTDALTRGATYSVTAVATSTNSYVLNPTSDTTTVSDGLTLGDNHLFVDGYSYSDGFANNIFNWPIMAENFDLANGGEAGHVAGGFGSTAFMTTPTTVSAGSSYTYTLQAGSWAAGTLELYPDGTFLANETGGGPVNASHLSGTWTDNGDGTATLNYDHSTLVIE